MRTHRLVPGLAVGSLVLAGAIVAGCAYRPAGAGGPGDTYCQEARAVAADAARQANVADANARGWAPYGGPNAEQSARYAVGRDAQAGRTASYVRRDC